MINQKNIRAYAMFLMAFLWLCAAQVCSQNITIKQITSGIPGVCDQVEFIVTVRNDENENWNENKLDVQLPCGFNYVSASVTGAAESDISDLRSPVFDLGNIPQKTEKVIRFETNLTCSALQCLNDGQLFRNEYVLTGQQGQKSAVSENFNIETPNIVISGIQDPFMEVGLGNAVLRKLTVRNTRLGRVSSFRLEDISDNILSITSDKGNVITNLPGRILIEIGPEEFEQIGNQDGYFDFGEEIIITETILADGCILVPKFVQSEISVSWGCFDETCKTSLVRATIKVLPRDDPGDKFSLTAGVEKPDCFYNSTARQRLSLLIKPTASALQDIDIIVEQSVNSRGFVVGSVVLPEGFTVTYQEEKLSACNQMVAKKILIQRSNISASPVGRNFDFYFDLAFCELSACDAEPISWRASYEYRKSCTKAEDVLQKGQFNARLTNTSNHQLDFLIEGSADDGKAGVLRYTYQSSQLTESQGVLRLRLVMPAFLTVINTNFAIGSIVPTVSQTILQGNRVIELLYPLPLPAASFTLLVPVIVNCAELTNNFSCTEYISNCTEVCSFLKQYAVKTNIAFITDPTCPAGGHFEECDFVEFLSNCKPECTMTERVGGFVNYDFKVTRKSLGLPDKNGDNIPDPDGIYDMSLIRHDQIFYGDTFDVEMIGSVVTEHPDSVYRNAVVRLSYIPVTDNSAYLQNAAVIDSLSFTLWDKSENRTITFENIPYTFNNLTYAFDLSADSLRAINSALPENFQFENGDSLFLTIRKVYINNFPTPSVGWNNHSLMFQYGATFSVTNRAVEPGNTYYVCGCPIRNMTFVGFNYWSQWAIPGVAQCPGVSNTQGVLLNYGFPNASPGEIKFFFRPVGFKIQKAGNIRLDSVAVAYGIVPQKIYYQFTEDDDFYYVDISDFTTLQNFRTGLRFWYYRSAETCIGETIPATTSEVIYETADYAKALFSDRITYTVQNFLSVPKVNLEIQQREFTALFANIDVPLKLINETNNQVRNVFIRPIYDQQSFSDVKIALNGLPVNYPDINGYFVMGNMFQKEIRDIRFFAKSLNCGRQKVVFEYGYDCGVYSNPAEKPCFIRRDSFFIDFQDGELEIVASQAETNIALCDTVHESKFTIFNGGLGHVFNLKPVITLPKGMEIIPGTCRIEFPTGSGQFFSIPDPINISGPDYQWDLASFWNLHLENGLSSVSDSPNNSFDIYYKTTTNCTFISGTSEKISVSGKQVCGLLTNKLIKSGPYLTVPGNPDPVQIDLSAMVPDTLFCQEIMPVEIQYENRHTEISYLYAAIPDGTEPVPGSFISNLPVVEPVMNNGVLEWSVPSGISSVSMRFSVRAKADADCQSGVFEITTSTGREAFCVATQTFCEIQDVSGRVVKQIDIQKPRADILRFEMVNHPDSVYYSLIAGLYISGLQQSVFGKIIYDENGDNIPGPDDPVLTTITFDPQTAVQNIIEVNARLNPDNVFNTCRLWLVIDRADNCLCSADTIQLKNRILFTTDTLNVCWNDTVTIGPVRQAEKMYQWNDGTGLSCNQCPNPIFSIPNPEDFQVTTYVRQITETDIFSGCVHEYSYQINVYPRPRILSTVDTLCKGDTVRLFTTEFSNSYVWSGATFIENEETFVKAVIEEPAWIYVTMTDSAACVVTDSVFIPVHEIPVTSFINDGRFCFGQEILIGYVPQNGLTYQWLDPKGILVSPDVNETLVNTSTDEEIYLIVENSGCFRTDTLPIRLFDGIDIVRPADTLFICQGDTLTIELAGADEFIWDPSFTGTCLNDSCSRVTFIPAEEGVYTFTVTGITTEGCREDIIIHVVGINDSRLATEEIRLCQGDSLIFAGNTIREDGIYCDTLSAGDCKYIQCKDVRFSLPDRITIADSICQGQTYTFLGQSYTMAGTYDVTLQNAAGCDSLITLELAVIPIPVFEIQDTFEMVAGSTRTITLPPGYTYSWNPSTGLSCNSCPEVVITADENITYTITAFNALNCPFTRTIRINVRESCMPEDIELPNAFTPNGDNQNDVYTIPGLRDCEVKITVFNRWGNIVYEESPFDNQWEGFSSTGHELPQGTYYILLESADGVTRKTGMIDLRRQ